MERRFLLFTASGIGYALALGEVAEVRESVPFYAVPRVPPHVVGVINSHGNLTALLDLGRFMGDGRVRGDGKVLVLDEKLAALALWVDEVKGIVLEEAVPEIAEGESYYEEARLETDFGTMRLLRVDRVVEAVEKQLTMDDNQGLGAGG